MPFYNDLTEATRKLITKESIVEIIFLRAACCAGGNGGNYDIILLRPENLLFLFYEVALTSNNSSGERKWSTIFNRIAPEIRRFLKLYFHSERLHQMGQKTATARRRIRDHRGSDSHVT